VESASDGSRRIDDHTDGPGDTVIGEGRAVYEAELGWGSSVFLVRPDGYVGLTAGRQATADQELAAYRKLWFAPTVQAHTH
jgi:hypothetical protein